MVYIIYVAGTKFSGKTALCLGLFNIFNELGMKVGYFKPVGHGYKMVDDRYLDPDVIMMKEVIGLSDPIEDICPIVLGNHYLDQISEIVEETKVKIRNSFE